MGALHGAYDGISSGTGAGAIPSLDQVLNVGNTSDIPILVATPNTNFNYFVNSTTGNDANDGLTAITAFATIQHAFNVIAGGRFPGMVTINLATGMSYNENLVTSAVLTANIDPDDGPLVVLITGDPNNPGAVAINGTGANDTISHHSNNVHLLIDGVTITADGTAGSTCIDVVDSRLSLAGVNLQGAITCLRGENSQIEWGENVVGAGGTVDCQDLPSSSGISVFNNSRCLITRDLTVQGFTLRGVFVNFSSAFQIINTGGTFTVTGSVPTRASGGITVSQGSQFLPGAITALNISNCDLTPTSAALSASVTGRFLFSTGTTVTITDCGIIASFTFSGSYSEGSVINWVVAGTTSNTVVLFDASFVNSGNGFSGATITKTQNANFQIALDARYTQKPAGSIVGALPLGATVFLTAQNPSATYMPLYVATDTEEIDALYVTTVTGNGPVTDTYEIFVNGAATGITVSITNGTIGTAGAIGLNLTALDTVGIRLVSDPATAATDCLAQLVIRRR